MFICLICLNYISVDTCPEPITDFWDSVFFSYQDGEGNRGFYVTNRGNGEMFQVGMDVKKIWLFGCWFFICLFHVHP